jgi:hypothetical protein
LSPLCCFCFVERCFFYRSQSGGLLCFSFYFCQLDCMLGEDISVLGLYREWSLQWHKEKK